MSMFEDSADYIKEYWKKYTRKGLIMPPIMIGLLGSKLYIVPAGMTDADDHIGFESLCKVVILHYKFETAVFGFMGQVIEVAENGIRSDSMILVIRHFDRANRLLASRFFRIEDLGDGRFSIAKVDAQNEIQLGDAFKSMFYNTAHPVIADLLSSPLTQEIIKAALESFTCYVIETQKENSTDGIIVEVENTRIDSCS
jgi:hypothetical protein